MPPWSRVEGKDLISFQGMLPDSGSILDGVHVWEVPCALMLSPGWEGTLCAVGAHRLIRRVIAGEIPCGMEEPVRDIPYVGEHPWKQRWVGPTGVSRVPPPETKDTHLTRVLRGHTIRQAREHLPPEVTQGQILSQSPTDATRFFWNLYWS